MSHRDWTEDELREVNERLEKCTAGDALRWVVDNFGTDEFALASSFAECVLVDMLVKIKPDARIFTIDTGLLFKETTEVIAEVEKKYGIKVERRTPRISVVEMERDFGPELWKRQADKCCEIRKVETLREVLSGLRLWITGLRREETPHRADAPIVGMDAKFGLIKVNPLAAWTAKDVWDYVERHGVPYNKLLDKGFSSIGCAPCTRAAGVDGDERAGRWAGTDKTECGIHR